ncbi:hypothetical protein [Variovorax sp. J22R115]|uniref:hypothetical protein n=1 Tax=Variovorax sp. J22R115 TaxID=3053509 RepID=UPI002574E0CA|nr:hypothetical protein [Variovorax sp. J22R115]MDM0051410.1 hypothetical protein [Variovorax sp. J22R115]
MSAENYAAMARKHWTKWLPRKVAALKADGDLESTLQTVGKQAQARLLELMQQGFREHEADEVVRSEFIQLKPEHGADMEQWERSELDVMEAEFRRLNRP